MKSEHGFTLVELLITVALTGILVSIVGPSIYQIFNVTEYGDDRLQALHELQNSASWFNYDGQTAVSALGGSGLTLTLPTAQTVTYAKSGTNLQRTSGTSTITLAQNVSSVSFTVSGRLVTMVLTSAPPGRMNVSEQGTYVVYLRPVP
ncbi:MAG: prepilin-type N-terminal cleavage/methylation domain-containing protein [Dehalococcoidales bacterium]|nr:prepilin-type N-terminal cleavage/methylation domain-containing protein [Dehalococcoidales bacterium]